MIIREIWAIVKGQGKARLQLSLYERTCWGSYSDYGQYPPAQALITKR